MLPYVVLHNQVSVDGRITGFVPDMGLHYEIAARFEGDIHLAGSNTILSMPGDVPPEDEGAFREVEKVPDDPRALLVVPDSRGRVRSWHYLRQQPYWRGVAALCSKATPAAYIEYLNKRHIDCVVSGEEHVDMRAALEELNKRFAAKRVFCDSGGTLNGILLRKGLVNEVSLLINPCMVGSDPPDSIFRATGGATQGAIPMKLVHVEQMANGFVWLRYSIDA